ncbi:MAG: M20 family metallopeptidase [Acidobacteriota bacterium]
MPATPPSFDASSSEQVLAAAREILPWMIEIRRDLHQYPELGLEEQRTATQIQARLDELDIPHIDGIGITGVMGLLRSPGERTVALRADIDALPIQDAKDVPYRSRVRGKMHACGHDVHTTCLLGAARLLSSLGEELGGTVKLLFQPAEETVGGAQLLIAAGVLENPQVEAIFGLHVEPDIDVGRFEVRYGQRNASSDNVKLTIHGRSGHGAYPADTVDAIVVAAQVISALQTVVSRNVDARDCAVVSFGTIKGGVAQNVVASKVELVGTVRCLDPEVRSLVLRRVRETAEGVARAFGGEAEVEIDPGYDPLINDDDAVALVQANAARLVGEEHVTTKATPNMGVEDFAYYVSQVPGAFFSLGVRNEAAGIVHSVHTERFDVDEECLAYGAAIQTLNALSILRR